jgi:hypothetical protein
LGVTRASSSIENQRPGGALSPCDGIIEPAAGDLRVAYPKAISQDRAPSETRPA